MHNVNTLTRISHNRTLWNLSGWLLFCFVHNIVDLSTMPIEFQRSCFFAADAIDGNKPLHERKKGMRKRLRRARKDRFTVIAVEAQIWTLASSLPFELVSEDAEYYAEMEAIAKLTLGSAVNEDFIQAATRKLGLHVLAPNHTVSLTNRAPSTKDIPIVEPPDALDDEQVVMLTNGYRPAEEALAKLRELCPDFFECYPRVRTWSDMKWLAKLYSVHTEGKVPASFRKRIRDAQVWWTECVEGSVGHLPLDHKQAKQLRRKLNSRQFLTLGKKEVKALALDEKDQLVVRASAAPSEAGFILDITTDNIITLYNPFWECKAHTLKEIPIVANTTDIRSFCDNRISSLIHEAMHSHCSIHARDVTIKLTPAERQLGPFQVNDMNCCKTYGIRLVFLLAQHSTENDDREAEENAESWSTMCGLRTLQVVYPEYSFLPNMQAWFDARSWGVKRREEPLHHCSLFDCMRHEDAGSILDLPGYDATKDTWGDQTGKKRPKDMNELLKVLVDLARREEQQEYERRLEWLRQATSERMKAKHQPRAKRLGLRQAKERTIQATQVKQAPDQLSSTSIRSSKSETFKQMHGRYLQQKQKRWNHKRIEKVRTRSRLHDRKIKTDMIAGVLAVDRA